VLCFVLLVLLTLLGGRRQRRLSAHPIDLEESS